MPLWQLEFEGFSVDDATLSVDSISVSVSWADQAQTVLLVTDVKQLENKIVLTGQMH